MCRKNCLVFFLVIFQTIYATAPELPLCPTNIAFFPQSLPMHCRMENGKTFKSEPIPLKPQSGATYPPSIYQSPSPNKVPPPMPFQVPPGFPAPIFPPGMPVPPMAAIPAPVPGMGVPMPGPPPQKLPVIVMPFYSPDPAHKKDSNDRRKKPKNKDSSESESCSDYDASDNSDDVNYSGFWRPGKYRKRRRGHRRIFRRSGGGSIRHTRKHKELLTPMIQYVTKEGYVIFEKEISKGEAKDWLSKKDERENEKGVSFKELDQIKHELGEDNIVEDHDEPKFIRVIGGSAKEINSNNPTPILKLRGKKFKKVEDRAATHNRMNKFHNFGKNKNQ